MQAAVGVLIAALALSSLHDPLLAAAAAVGAALLFVGAVRGWCPGSLIARMSSQAPAEHDAHGAHGISAAGQPLER